MTQFFHAIIFTETKVTNYIKQENIFRCLPACECCNCRYTEREQWLDDAIREGNMKYIRRLTDKAFAVFANALGAFCTVARARDLPRKRAAGRNHTFTLMYKILTREV
ncbi:MAG: hypothetical protein LBF62_04185 [Tannerellaceae bacterium]|nr:hypothetical protein [Tannerellaceae bacterium]